MSEDGWMLCLAVCPCSKGVVLVKSEGSGAREVILPLCPALRDCVWGVMNNFGLTSRGRVLIYWDKSGRGGCGGMGLENNGVRGGAWRLGSGQLGEETGSQASKGAFST